MFHKEQILKEIDSKTYINGIKNDLKTAIDDIFEIFLNLQENLEKIKEQTKNT